MKIRNDFVTNSSSSSFIIAFKDITKIVDEKHEEFQYLKIIKNLLEKQLIEPEEDVWYGSYEGEIVDNIVDLEKYFKNHYIGSYSLKEYFEEYPEREDLYNELINFIKNNYEILFREISNNDETMKNLIESLNDNINFIVVQN